MVSHKFKVRGKSNVCLKLRGRNKRTNKLCNMSIKRYLIHNFIIKYTYMNILHIYSSIYNYVLILPIHKAIYTSYFIHTPNLGTLYIYPLNILSYTQNTAINFKFTTNNLCNLHTMCLCCIQSTDTNGITSITVFCTHSTKEQHTYTYILPNGRVLA